MRLLKRGQESAGASLLGQVCWGSQCCMLHVFSCYKVTSFALYPLGVCVDDEYKCDDGAGCYLQVSAGESAVNYS